MADVPQQSDKVVMEPDQAQSDGAKVLDSKYI